MLVENAVYPTGAQLGALAALPADRPIVMLNLLRFKPKAVYADGRGTSLTGREAYALYGEQMMAFVQSRGGRVLYTGHIDLLAIGVVDDMWDMTALVEYPSGKDFVEIATSPEVAAFGVHREAGLAGQLLIQCTTR